MQEIAIQYDDLFAPIDHYRAYPEMKPWVGCNYSENKIKLLLIGESHYLEKGSIYHLDPEVWYAGISVSDKNDGGWINTRNIISNGIKSNWKEKSKTIYRNIEKALFESSFFSSIPQSAFTEVAFMNYFQRPAEITGKSIKVSALDASVSGTVLLAVTGIIKPDIVVFTSSLAWRHAKKNGVISLLASKGIALRRSPHPGMPWWNKVSKAYGNLTGKNYFIKFINEQVSINSLN